MAVEKVQVTVTEIKEWLDNGATWYKKDDLGYGSVQVNLGATDQQIFTIRKHPKLKDFDTCARIFVIIDDTKDDTTVHAKEPVYTGSGQDNVERSNISVGSQTADMDPIQSDSFSAFANL